MQKQRSRVWIVTTHVISAGVLLPALGWAISLAVEKHLGLDAFLAFVVRLSLVAAGYVIGTLYSVWYLRRTTGTDLGHCVAPAQRAFFALCLAGLLAQTAMLLLAGGGSGPRGADDLVTTIAMRVGKGTLLNEAPLRDGGTLLVLVLFYTGICWFFSDITELAFASSRRP